MAVRQMNVLPEALNMGFSARVHEAVVGRQYDRLGTALHKQGVVLAMGESAIDAPWSALMEVTDRIEGATAIVDEASMTRKRTEATVTAEVGFGSTASRDTFHDVYEGILAGVHGPHMPQIRGGDADTLRVRNMSHADVVSLGRVGTAFFLEEYGNKLGPNKRAVIQKTVGEIQESGVMPFLPAELRDRVDMQADTIGPDTLLTSGRISVLGLATRDALQKRHAMMFMQRPRDNRPAIEDGISFPSQSSRKGIPLSDSSIAGQVVDDLTNRAYEIVGPARRRDVAGTAGSIANIIGGMGLTEIGSAVGGSLITVGRAVVPATIGAVQDFGLRRQLNR